MKESNKISVVGGESLRYKASKVFVWKKGSVYELTKLRLLIFNFKVWFKRNFK